MCGIGGIVRFDGQPIGAERPRRMLDYLLHRGPDGHGTAALGPCVLVHARLSVIDLLGGHQPMSVPARDGAGELTLTFNGEIYNHRALRRQLEGLGHVFVSDHCDTEVLLHGYRAWGTELPKHLHGMFAFAVWDAQARRLLLCRDRAGKKPLYVRRGGGEVGFASLVAALVGSAGPGDRPTVDRAALLTFLRLGYPFGSSLVAGIEELPAAHWMLVEADGRCRTERYWQPPPISRTSTSIGAAEGARELLDEAVAKRLESDVPLGCFLSGGIDSSVVAAIAAAHLRQRGEPPLRTFSVAMPHLAYDESAAARAVAAHIGADHTELRAEPGDGLLTDLARLTAVAGEPLADSSLLPTYWLSRASREHVKVALSGDGGDEYFGGYDRYRAMRLLRRCGRLLRVLPGSVLPDRPERSRPARLRRLLHAARGAGPAERYRRMIHLFTDDDIAALAPADAGACPVASGWPDEPNPVQAAMMWDQRHYLPFDLLRKVDRASMAVALEVRCPLLDTEVCDLAGHLPERVLMPGGRPKELLRRVARELLPPAIVRRPKRGFAVPIGGWFATTLREPLTEHLRDPALQELGLAPGPIQRMLRDHLHGRADHTHRLFALLSLSLWARWLRSPKPPRADG